MTRRNFHRHVYVGGGVNTEVGNLFVQEARILELKVELVQEDAHDNLGRRLSKRFAETNSSAAVERNKTHGISLATTGSFGQRVRRVESFWQELFGTDPFSRVVRQSEEVHEVEVAFAHVVVTDFLVTQHDTARVHLDRRSVAKSFIEEKGHVLQVVETFVG